MTVAAYVRVSSRSQDLATQRDAIGRCAKARGDEISVWFEEKRSASTLERAELGALRAAVRRGEVRTVYVFRLDRFARSGIRDTLGLLEELRAGGARVVTVADGFELEGPFAEVVTAVMAWAAQMERLALGERILAARTRVEAGGKRWGRPRRAGDELAARVRALRSGPEKLTIRKIAVALKVPRSTVQAILAEKGAYKPGRPPTKKPGPKPGLKKSQPRPSE